MHRVLRVTIAPLVVTAVVVLLAVACNEDKGEACTADPDCPTGNICSRDLVCVSIADGGAFDADLNPDTGASCSSDGIPCNLAAECCSGSCTENKCATTGTSTPACKNVYELCQNDCCSGLMCINGACR